MNGLRKFIQKYSINFPIILIFCSVLICVAVSYGMPQLPVGWTTEAKIVDIHDGDTVIVEITKKIHVRLLDCWAAELNTEEGVKAKEALVKIIGNRNDCVLYIPADKKQDLSHIMTFGRILGYVFVNKKNVSEEMVRGGYATKVKE